VFFSKPGVSAESSIKYTYGADRNSSTQEAKWLRIIIIKKGSIGNKKKQEKLRERVSPLALSEQQRQTRVLLPTLGLETRRASSGRLLSIISSPFLEIR
jgi:hypothetical protein